MYYLKWAKSKKLLDGFIDRYNFDKPLFEQLRSSHRKLAEHLLFLYSVAIAREQAYGEGLTLGALPVLRTNNRQLADAMGCKPRTIINLRKRLKTANLITKEFFHGSNSQYGIELSHLVMHLQLNGNPENLIFSFGVQHTHTQTPTHTHLGVKTLPHTVSSTKQGTNQLIELGGADLQLPADFQSVVPENTVSFGGKAVENEENVVENPQLSSGRGTKQELGTGYESGRCETGRSEDRGQMTDDSVQLEKGTADCNPQSDVPTIAPNTTAEVVKNLSQELRDKINRHIQVLWTAIILKLYDDKWICEQEAERGKARLAEYFIYAQPERFGAGASEILERVILVKRWLEREHLKGNTAWIPLPGKYFDIRNRKNGFINTKAWYKKHIQEKRKIKANELLTKAIKQYLKSQEDGAKVGPSETYRKITQRLGKYDAALLDRFHQQIININNHETETTQAQS